MHVCIKAEGLFMYYFALFCQKYPVTFNFYRFNRKSRELFLAILQTWRIILELHGSNDHNLHHIS